jgi:abortive infection bacteriophage resistance protein
MKNVVYCTNAHFHTQSGTNYIQKYKNVYCTNVHFQAQSGTNYIQKYNNVNILEEYSVWTIVSIMYSIVLYGYNRTLLKE